MEEKQTIGPSFYLVGGYIATIGPNGPTANIIGYADDITAADMETHGTARVVAADDAEQEIIADDGTDLQTAEIFEFPAG